MAKYSVEIIRSTFATKTFNIEAKSEQEAIDAALEEAHNTSFEEEDTGYDVGEVEEEEE